MTTRNLFDGESFRALFAKVIYQRLRTREWFSYADVMAEYMGLPSADMLPCNVSNCDNYGELKKAFPQVCKAIRQKEGDASIEKRGNNRGREYRYVGKEDDPLADMRNAQAIKDIQKYYQFCQNSAGFFPESWLEYYFKDCMDLFAMKTNKHQGEQVISSSLDRRLTNIELLPFLYESIKNRQVLKVQYKPYEKDSVILTFHPHYLREYNGRWFLLGHAEGLEPELGYNLALDRIQGRPQELNDVPYCPSPKSFYKNYYDDIVGVTHPKDSEPVEVIIRAHSSYMYGLTETKPIHSSQKVHTPFGHYPDGEYGDFSVKVVVNNEFYGRILQMGDGLEIMSPNKVRQEISDRINDIIMRYLSNAEK